MLDLGAMRLCWRLRFRMMDDGCRLCSQHSFCVKHIEYVRKCLSMPNFERKSKNVIKERIESETV